MTSDELLELAYKEMDGLRMKIIAYRWALTEACDGDSSDAIALYEKHAIRLEEIKIKREALK